MAGIDVIFDILAKFRPEIEGALEYAHGSHTFDDIAFGVMRGVYQIWPGDKAVAVTEILEYPRKRALNVFLVGGDLEELKTIEPKLEDFAREHGCTEFQATGRKGWLRAHSDGWKPAGYTLRKALS